MARFCIILLCISTMFCAACKDNTPAPPAVAATPNTFTVTGGSYSNSLFNSYTVTRDSMHFTASSGLTHGIVRWNNGASFVEMDLCFAGNKAGTFALGPTSVNADTNSVNINHTNPGGVGTSQFYSYNGTLTVSKYDAVGGQVKGSFSGSFTDAAGQLYTITNGAFAVVRGADN